MVFKEFLTLVEAEVYLQNKNDLPVEFEDLQHLERADLIKPVVYLTDIIFSTDVFITDFSDKSPVSGYFSPSKFILLDRFRVNPYREYLSQFFHVEDFDFFNVVKITQYSTTNPSIDEEGLLRTYNSLDDKGEGINELPYSSIFIRRSELDAVLNSDDLNGSHQSQQKQSVLEAEETLHPRTANNAAKIISALASELLKMDITQPYSKDVNGKIKAAIERQGNSISKDVVADWLKLAHEQSK